MNVQYLLDEIEEDELEPVPKLRKLRDANNPFEGFSDVEIFARY